MDKAQIWIICLFSLLLPFSVKLQAQHLNTKVEAILNIDEKEDNLIEITGGARNVTEEVYALRYELSVISSNKGENHSKNQQSGYFTLEGFQQKELSTTVTKVTEDKRIIILLLIYDEEDRLLGSRRKMISSGFEKKEENEVLSYKKPNEGIQLKGLIVENTKTKFGKDFYDFFGQQFRLNGMPENKIIYIEEKINFGRTTRIIVRIDQQLVFQFFAKPQLEYLKEMAKISLQRVNRYFEQEKKNDRLIKRY